MAQLEFLGKLSDRFERTVTLDIPKSITTLAHLRPWLNSHYQCDDFSQPTIRAIIDGAVVAENHEINNRHVITFFPPVGGG